MADANRNEPGVAAAPVEPMPAAVLQRLWERFSRGDPNELCLADYRDMLHEITRLRGENVRLSLARRCLRMECESLIRDWDSFAADCDSVNPLDYPISDRVEAIRRALKIA